MQGLALVAFITVLVAAALFGVYRNWKNQKELVAAAAAKGWSLVSRDDSVLSGWSGNPFGSGHNRQAHNIVTGKSDAGRDFVAFSYLYHTTETSSDAQGHLRTREESHWYGIVSVDTRASFPGLSVYPEHAAGRLFGRLTNTDIQLESEDFNRDFTVHCPDRKFASDVLNPRMMAELLKSPGVGWEFRGTRLLAVTSGHLDLPGLQAHLEVFETVLTNVPTFVWDDHTTSH